MKKFIKTELTRNFNLDFDNSKRWAKDEQGSFKLISPDYEKDRQFFNCEVKAVKEYKSDDKLWISGIANANIVDRMQERLDPRGLDVTDYLKNKQLLAHHSYYHPVGQVEELDIQEDGVHFSAWVGDPKRADLTEMQKEIRSLVVQGILKTVSVGFIPKRIKAPIYDNTGILQEPCVIEKWELLEISLVAIPCNQDSVFSIRDYAGGKSNDTLEASQAENDLLNNDNLGNPKTGADDVSGKKDGAKAPEDNKQDNVNEEMITLLRTMNETSKRVEEVCGLILKKMEEKPTDETPPDDETPPPEGDKTVTPPPEADPVKTLEARLVSLEETNQKIVAVLGTLAKKLG